MTLFLYGLITGLGIGSVAAYLAATRWIIPGVVDHVIERYYREGWLKPEAEAWAAKYFEQRA